MDIAEHIKLQQARVSALNSKIATAQALGDIARLTELEYELTQAEETLDRLKNA